MLGIATSPLEIINVSKHDFWLLIADEKLFLSFNDFPWFKTATIEQISKVERPSENHLYWPRLDIDLALESIRDPSAFPLVATTTGK